MLSSMKVLALLSSLYKSSGVMGPVQSVCYLYPKDCGTADSLYCCVIDEEWCVSGLASPEVDDDVLGFVDIQGQVVGLAPIHWMFHLLSVGLVVVITDMDHYCCVICKLHNGVICGPGTTVGVIRVNSRGPRKQP